MGEKKGYLFTLVFFIGIIVPAIFMFGVDALNQSAFTKTTAEVGEMVKEEGGVTAKVADTVNELQRKGYEIRFTNNGSNVTSAVPYGTTIVAHYKYKYHAGFFPRELNVSNKLEILKRDSVGSGNIEQGGVIKTITVNSDEIEKADHVQTWNIPYLKSIRNITSNSGSAHVVNQQGENVTISMNNGSPSRQELIENGEIEDRKYVEGIDHEYYEDAEGYKGILEKYLVRGSLIDEKTKYIEKHNEEDYADAEGYTGKLDRYFVGGNLYPEHTKEVSEKLTSEVDKSTQQKNVTELVTSNEDSFADSILYNKDGYKGTLYKKDNPVKRLISGELKPSETKYIEGETSKDYNKDGFIGELERYVVSGEYIEPKIIKHNQTNTTNVFPDTIVKDGVTLSKKGSPKQSILTPADTKYASEYLYDSAWRLFAPDINADPIPMTTYYSDEDGYKGTLNKIGNNDYIKTRSNPTSTVWSFDSNSINELNVPFADFRKTPSQLPGESNVDYIARLTFNNFTKNFGYSDVIVDKSSIDWKGPYYSGSFVSGSNVYKYRREVKANYTVSLLAWRQAYGGNVTKPATYQYTQEYEGILPAKDTREYAYRGYVTKPEEDTRIYEFDQEYEGVVTEDTDVLFPDTIEYDKDGYKGVLRKDKDVTENVVSGEYLPYDEKYIDSHDSMNYNADGYSGTLEKYVVKGELIPEDSKGVIDSIKVEYKYSEKPSEQDVFPNEIEYNKDDYFGVLSKDGASKEEFLSGEYVPYDEKYISEYDSAEYSDNDGYKGALEKYVYSGEYQPEINLKETITNTKNEFSDSIQMNGYELMKDGSSEQILLTPSDTKYAESIKKGDKRAWRISDLEIPTLPDTAEVTSSNPESELYGYKGTLYKTGEINYIAERSSPVTLRYHFYTNDPARLDVNLIDLNGYETQLPNENGIDYVYRKSLEYYETLDYTNLKINKSTLDWNGPVYNEVNEINGVTYNYKRTVEMQMTADVFTWNQLYSGYVTKPATYKYTQNYSLFIPEKDTRVYKYHGKVVRPESDTRKYQLVQNYKGIVTKPESDTREYKYRGTVRRPESDTRKYEYVQSYKGDVTKPESDTREYAYHGNVSKPAEDTREYKYRGEVVKRATSNTGEMKPYYQYEITIEYEAWQ